MRPCVVRPYGLSPGRSRGLVWGVSPGGHRPHRCRMLPSRRLRPSAPAPEQASSSEACLWERGKGHESAEGAGHPRQARGRRSPRAYPSSPGEGGDGRPPHALHPG